jgi:predicted AAA+ superfamily ATPase
LNIEFSNSMIERELAPQLRRLAATFPVVLLTGARQSGKTTLARALFEHLPYVSLENPDERDFAQADPRRFLARYGSGAVFDEVQRVPDLLSYLQPLVDSPSAPSYVLTGSSNFSLLASVTQSLAGRAGIARLAPLTLSEQRSALRSRTLDSSLWHGSYPGCLVGRADPRDFFASYVETYVERDVRMSVNVRDLSRFRRFVRLSAARIGQLINLASLGADAGVAQPTAAAWLDVLETSHLVYRLAPYHRNFGKRLVKTPKLYFIDTGLVAWLLGIADPEQLAVHPLRGALFENFAVVEILKHRWNHGNLRPMHFWRDSNGREVDLILDDGPRLLGIEIKSGATFAADWNRDLDAWRATVGRAQSDRPVLIWGGRDSGPRRDVYALAWDRIAALPEALQA